MKKTFKKLLTCTAALTIFAVSSLSVSAIYNEYDLENPDYQARVDSLKSFFGGDGVTPRNDEIAPLVGDDVKYIYGSVYELMKNNNSYSATHYIETGTDTTRHFNMGFIYWTQLQAYDTEEFDFTEEDVKSFISDNNLKAEIITFSSEYRDNMPNYPYKIEVRLNYNENISVDEIIDTVLALNKEFGFKLGSEIMVSNESYSDEVVEPTEDVTSPTVNFGAPTIVGDLDLNDEQGISDIVTLAKYNASPDLYPITDPTALANADMNGDKVIDSLDAAILIETALGTYQSAV